MTTDANPDEVRFTQISEDLADAIDAVVATWIERLVVERVGAWRGPVDDAVVTAASAAGESARDDLMPRLRALLSTDVDEQRANPLALLRDVTSHAHEVLVDLGAPAAARDPFSRSSFPADTYDLVPATWVDIDDSLREIGITWGAAKAFVHKARHRTTGES